MGQPYFPPWPQALPASKCGGSVQGEQVSNWLLTSIYQPIPLISPNNYIYIARHSPPSTCKPLQIHGSFPQTSFGNERSILVFQASTGLALFVGSRSIRPPVTEYA